MLGFGSLEVKVLWAIRQNSPSIAWGLVRACASQGFGPEIPLMKVQRLCPGF
jgi:hypothetical protein